VNPLTAAVARQVLGLEQLAFLAEGGTWGKLPVPYSTGSRAWRYRTTRDGIDVKASPAGPGLVRWSELRKVVVAGLTPERATRVRGLASLERDPSNALAARRCGLPVGLPHPELIAAGQALAAEVVDAGLAVAGEQLALFGKARP
jgi:hypothetical protein